MAVVRDLRHLKLLLPFPKPSERCSCFLLPLPPSTVSATTAAISTSDLEKLQNLGGGTVYKVRHKDTSAINALKVIHDNNVPAFCRQTLCEVSILRRTDSPYVIKCNDVLDLPGGDIAICMQHMH